MNLGSNASPGHRTHSRPDRRCDLSQWINGALRVLKKKMQREGTFREMKRRRSYEKPSKRVREKAEAVRRYRKAMRERLEREGY